ncbi:hypothetical protein [Mucilaginibacter aquariorum]|uniref:AlgX/AlgJ SGNH hydrolase-like domain-containing protein n=1 Tax=Mucilaginibacter aquariorum TaxID=2967225 RepID=A0ABT1SYC6_9SPHI|nr:hypothetical protein [Mucilaginibacter aquariorum]MCQ6957282.1 hypothetical protein [Mucilaginibacter aquariorum]
MKRIAGIILLVISIIMLVTAMNQSFINKIKQEKYFGHLDPKPTRDNLIYGFLFTHSDRWRYGDLYGLCYLPQYKFELEPFKRYNLKKKQTSTGRILYIIGDSFLADKTLYGAFEDFDDVIFLDNRFPFGPVIPDPTKQNYLVLEFAERNLVGYELNKTGEAKQRPTDKPNSSVTTTGSVNKPDISIAERLGNVIFNKALSRNLEMILFDNKIATIFKETKASLNYSLFKRVANEVAVSTDKKRLFLNTTVDTDSVQSAFRHRPNAEVNSIRQNLSIAKNYYSSIGFNKVFLSVIPNPVSVYDNKRMTYNHLLERIEQGTDLPVISIYNIFRTDKRNLFYRSDAHWNPDGFEIWINETNKVLKANLN